MLSLLSDAPSIDIRHRDLQHDLPPTLFLESSLQTNLASLHSRTVTAPVAVTMLSWPERELKNHRDLGRAAPILVPAFLMARPCASVGGSRTPNLKHGVCRNLQSLLILLSPIPQGTSAIARRCYSGDDRPSVRQVRINIPDASLSKIKRLLIQA
jgi:hypothetical protein